VALLLHFPPSVPPTAAGRGGATRAQKLAGVDGYGYRERDGEGDYVLEVAGDGASLFPRSEAPFIGQRRGKRDGQYGYGLGFPTPSRGHRGSSAAWGCPVALW
jgi:hypothetical protein